MKDTIRNILFLSLLSFSLFFDGCVLHHKLQTTPFLESRVSSGKEDAVSFGVYEISRNDTYGMIFLADVYDVTGIFGLIFGIGSLFAIVIVDLRQQIGTYEISILGGQINEHRRKSP